MECTSAPNGCKAAKCAIMLRFTSLVLAVATFYLTNALPNGAPPEACDTLTPNHGADPQTSEVPYIFTNLMDDFVNDTYIPGETYTY